MTACYKCKSGVAFVASREGGKKPYCAECFEAYVEIQVRDTFFKHCGTPPDTKIAIACSGGAGSMSLMNILGRLRAQNIARGGAGHVNFDFVVLHLSEQGVVVGSDPSGAHRATTTDSFDNHFSRVATMICREAERSGFDADRVVATTFSLSELINDSEVVAFLNGRAPLTEREDVYKSLKTRCILNAARALGCVGVIFGDHAVTCAIGALSCVVRGRGCNIVSVAGARGEIDGVAVMRPMRGLLPKEVYMFARAKGIGHEFTPAPGFGTSLRSIDRTLEMFVNSLQIGFKSTVFNVLQAVSKLKPPFDDSGRQELMIATKSGRPPPIPIAAREVAANEFCDLCGGAMEAGDTARSALCYGCRVLQNLLPSDAFGSVYRAASASKRGVRLMTAKEVQGIVSDCLVDEEQ